MNTHALPAASRRWAGTGILTVLAVLGIPAPASADISATGFFGIAQPNTRIAKGLSFGVSILGVGFELEYGDVPEKVASSAPRLRTGMANGIVHVPFKGASLYATAGAGVYRESLSGGHRETHAGLNLGGGLKRRLYGPLKLRLDYRLFRLQGEALHPTVHRVYAGINAAF